MVLEVTRDVAVLEWWSKIVFPYIDGRSIAHMWVVPDRWVQEFESKLNHAERSARWPEKLCKLSASVIGHGQIQSNPLCNFQLRDISLLQKNSRFQIIYISDVLFIAQNTAIYSEGGPKQINITGKNQNANSYTDVIIEKIYPDMETLWKYVGLPFL